MISKQKRNTILAYCMASVIMLFAGISNVPQFTTQLIKSNSKRVVTENNYVETNEVSYGLVAIEASSSIEDNKDAKKATEEKKEEKKEQKKSSNNKTTTKKRPAQKRPSSGSSTTSKLTSNKELGQAIVDYAKQFVGNPYRMGGTSLTNGADCSGFTQSVFKHFGIKLPRTASSQASVGVKVPWNKLEPGDLVFYSNGGSRISHVAIYIGNGKIVHAQTPRYGIGITTYNIMTKVTARRVIK